MDSWGNDKEVNIVKEYINLPNKSDSKKLAFVLYNVLSKEECDNLIFETEKRGYEPALINIGNGMQKLMSNIRNNDRCIVDSIPLANRIWKRIYSKNI
jgi:hypothetical protein